MRSKAQMLKEFNPLCADPAVHRFAKEHEKKIERAARSEMSGHSDFPGWCVACGRKANGVEPDAREYICEGCGNSAVFGAEELCLWIWC